MEQKSDRISQMCAITISREYGSGGGEIAYGLAQRLQWQLVDHEIVVRVAREMGVSEQEAEKQDEYAESTTSRILNSLQSMQPALFAVAPSGPGNERNYRQAIKKVIEGALIARHVIIVGRGGQVLLAGRPDVLRIRIVASLQQRVAYVMQRESMSHEDALARIQVNDHDRFCYLQAVYHQQPNDPHLYDLSLNTDILSLNQIIDLIVLALEYKAEQITLPVEQLGPGTGLLSYPGPPSDLRLALEP